MAKKNTPKRKSTSNKKKSNTPQRFSSKAKRKAPAPKPEIEPLYGNFFEKYIYPRANWVALGIMAILCLIVFGDYLFGEYLYLFKNIGSDTLNIVYPARAQWADLVREAGFTSWSFRQGMGQNVYPMGLHDPFSAILMMFGKETIPYVMAWNGVLQILLAGFFFFKYLKTLGRDTYVTIIGSVIYAFSGYVMGVHSWVSFSILFIAGPLLLWGVELLLKKNNWIVFPIGVYFIAGPRLVTFGIFLFVYSLFRYVDENGWDLKGLIIFWLKMAGLGALGLMMASWFFGVKFTALLGSSRISGPASRASTLSSEPIFGLLSDQVGATSIMRLFSNEILGPASVDNFKGYRNYLESPFYYVGLASLLLIPQTFFHLSKKQKALFAGLLAFWLFLAAFPWFRYAYFLFVTDHFRSFSLHLSYILLFFGLFALSKIIQHRKVDLPTLGISLVALLILLNYPWESVGVDSRIQTSANIFLVLNAVMIYLLTSPRLKYIAQVAFMLLICTELTYFAYSGTHHREPLTKAEYKAGKGYNDATYDALASIRDKDDGFFRIQKDFTSSPAVHYSLNDAMVQGFFGTPSYQSQNQKNYIRFLYETEVIEANDVTRTKWAPGLRSRFMLRNLANVKYVLRQDNGSDLLQQGHSRFGGVDNIRIFKNDYFLPFGYTYDSYFSYNEFKQVPKAKKDIGFLKAAVVFEENMAVVKNLRKLNPANVRTEGFNFNDLQKDISQRSLGAFQMTDFQHDYLKGTVNLDKEKLVFFSIPFDEGWSAKVNGKEVELLQVNIGFMGFVLPQGEHEIELSHQPTGLTVLWLISLLGFGIFAYICYRQWKQSGQASDITSSIPSTD